MPCMILTGHPCAGKSTLAQQIRERALLRRSRLDAVVIINETTSCPDQSIAECYASSFAEKKTRAALKSDFDRAVAAADKNKTLIILDSCNYIKGFRYELFTISKEHETSHCVVWCLNDLATVVQWNDKRLATSDRHTYSKELLESLIGRYEPPDERNRWDKPLYKIDLRPPDVRSASLAGEVLNQSVYNMHNLSEAIASLPLPDDSAENALPVLASGDTDAANGVPKKGSAASTFKRAVFKRPSKDANGVNDAPKTVVPSVRTTPLTAEALASLVEASGAPETKECCESTISDSVPVKDRKSAKSDSKETEPQLKSIEQQIDDILDSFLSNVHRLQGGASTRQHVASDADALDKVDALTQQLLNAIQTAQDKSTSATGQLVISFKATTLFLDLRRRVSATELRRIRRQYIQWVSTNPPENGSELEIAKSFLAYIETTQ